MHHAQRQRQQRKLLALALTVMGNKAARFQVLVAVEAPALALKILQQIIQPCTPVFRTEHQEKIIAADVADKVACWVHALAKALRQAQQSFVTFGVAIQVVLRLNS